MSRILNVLIACALFVQLCGSCSPGYRNVMFQSSSDDHPGDNDQGLRVGNESDGKSEYYRIQHYDLLTVRNVQDLRYIVPDYSSRELANTPISYRVDEAGCIALPSIGKVMVAGLTRGEAEEKVQRAYELHLLKDPIIQLELVNPKVTVLGEFTRPGNFLLEKDNTSLVEVIGQAGGLTPQADARKVKIIRGDRKRPETIYINLKNLSSLASEKLRLQNGDLIYVGPRRVYGSVEQTRLLSGFVQPALLFLNTALVIYNLTR